MRRPLLHRFLFQVGALCVLWSQPASCTSIPLSDVNHLFAFGDSYTASGYSPANSILNIPLLGNTTSGGLNWLQYLALSSPTTNNTFFDLAVSGATVNNTVVNAGVASFQDQVATFQQYFVPPPASAPWISNQTLFTIWIGINDVGYSSVALNASEFPAVLPDVISSYKNLVTTLYAVGARKFLVMGIPPTQRTPYATGLDAVALFATNIGLMNDQISALVQSMPTLFPNSTTVLYDTQPLFNTILDSPLSFGFENSTTYCPAYGTVTTDPSDSSLACGWPMNEYFWWNFYHPTWPVHRYLATSVLSALSGTSTLSIASATPTDTVARATASVTTVASSAAGTKQMGAKGWGWRGVVAVGVLFGSWMVILDT